jgi:homoserine O-acetyltransferase
LLTSASLLLAAAPLYAAEPAKPVEGSWVAPRFQFHTGQTLENLRLHYVTLGERSNPAVLVLHGTYQSAGAMLSKDFGGQLFGPGQPLDASKYFIIIPDGIGVGKSTKPSDGLRAAFPQYNYDDMVLAQYRMLTEGRAFRTCA